jgi:hypothetical protein
MWIYNALFNRDGGLFFDQYILISMNNKQTVGGIFCDLQKAFDCVNHEMLVDKWDFYGIEGTLKKLLKSYLAGRQQRVILGHLSVLSPLLFLFYINDLPKMVLKHNRLC